MKRIKDKQIRGIISISLIVISVLILYIIPENQKIALSLVLTIFITMFCGLGWSFIILFVFPLLSIVTSSFRSGFELFLWLLVGMVVSHFIDKSNNMNKGKKRIMDIREKPKETIKEKRREIEPNTVQMILKTIEEMVNANCVILYTRKERIFKREISIYSRVLDLCDEIIPDSGIILCALREARTIYVPLLRENFDKLNYYNGEPPPIKSLLVHPLAHNDGLIIIDSLNQLPEGSVELIKRLARIVEESLSEITRLGHYIKLKDEFENFYHLSKRLNNSSSIEDVLSIFAEKAKELVYYDYSLFIFHDEENNLNRIKGCQGVEKGLLGREFDHDPDRNLISWVIKNKTPLDYNNLKERESIKIFDESFDFPFDFNSCFIVPFQVVGRSFGCSVFLRSSNEPFSVDSKKMVEAISNQAASSIQNINMYKDMEKMATMDGLTNLYNHRTFQENIILFIERAARRPEKISLVILDLDHFKSINDNFGHTMGDTILKSIGKILIEETRKIDFVARIGGEEFALILANTDTSGAYVLAERIRKRIVKSEFKTQHGILSTTCSFGIATYSKDAGNKELLIERADKAMYMAKNSGRNCTVAWSGEEKAYPVNHTNINIENRILPDILKNEIR